MSDKYDPEKIFLKRYDYNVWSENKEESTDKEKTTDVPPMLSLEGDEK